MKYFVHQNALCESHAIGDGTRVWAFAHILPRATIGKDCNVCDHVFIENDDSNPLISFLFVLNRVPFDVISLHLNQNLVLKLNEKIKKLKKIIIFLIKKILIQTKSKVCLLF